jgi:M6 family metalloprotease-like protein
MTRARTRTPLQRDGRVPAARRAHALLLAAALLPVAFAAPLAAQDIEARARPGVRLPDSYFALIREQPDFFEIDRGWSARHTLTPRSTAAAVEGTLPLVVIQALFSDSPEPWVTRDEIQRVLFDGPAPYGTVTEFYHEVSGGRMTVTGQVTPWVRTQITRAETVASSFGIGSDARTGTFLVQALVAADAFVDFAQFDNDGPDGIPNSGDDDGFVDAVAVQYIERAASCGGDAIWPHRSRVRGWMGQPYASQDIGANGQPILVDSYIMQSTVNCAGDELQSAGTISHELGHVFGLPDLYHRADGILPSQRRWVVGCWTLMAAGSWGCGDGASWPVATRPSHMGPWEKSVLGWIQEEVVQNVRDREFVLQPVQTSGRSLLVPLGPQEYLQLEYRPQIGFDVELPSSGVLIYHIDLNRPMFPATSAARIYRIALREADGDSALVRTAAEGGNRGVAGDAWAINGVAAFSALTQPALRRNSGAPSTVTIHSIAVGGGVARVRISNIVAPAVVEGQTLAPGVALGEWSHELRAAGGALPYSWTVQGLPPGVGIETLGERLRLRGTPLAHGAFAVVVRITDALGTIASTPLTLAVVAAELSLERMLQPLLRNAAAPLTADEQTYLDRTGNNNGRYDIGDLRRALRSGTVN